MREIEVKARVSEPAKLIEKLEALGCVFTDPVSQEDIIFVREPGSSVDEYLENHHFLRLRTLGDGRTIFTAKHNPSRKHFGDTVTTEHETEIASRDIMADIILMLGFTEAVRVTKHRRTAKLDEFEICLDELPGIGSFIEVERCVADDSEHDAIVASMHALLSELGIAEEDKKVKRYDIQMLDLHYGN
ncbi:MAG: class IV adenylate cyclase [Patescibacteria group bacterium]